jgi:cyclic nucleotide gated channel beta 1
VGAEGNRRTADVRVKGFTNLFILSKADFESAMSEFPAAHKMLKKRARYIYNIYIIP